MPIQVVCFDCSATYRVKDSAAGKSLKCKRCGTELTIPQESPLESSEAMPWESQPSNDDGIDMDAILSPTKSRGPAARKRKPAVIGESNRSKNVAKKVPIGKQDLGAGVYLEGIEGGWRLVASTLNVEGLLVGGIGWITMGLIALFVGGDVLPVLCVIVPIGIGMGFVAYLVLAVSPSMQLSGRIEITVEGDRCTVFSGIGTSGSVQHVSWSVPLKIGDECSKSQRGEWHEIVLSGVPPVRTGKHLTREQASVVLQTLIRLQPVSEG